MREWTSSQRDAIHADGGPLLVTAAAGSGKTSVLTERILRRILEDRVEVDRLLVVTFTRAAAAEMQERIASGIAKLVAQYPSDRFLVRQQMRLPRASISTVHSFCMTFIRENFRKAQVECDFRLMDEEEYNLLKWDVLDEVLECCYEQKEPGFLQLAELLSGDRDDNDLRKCVLHLYNSMVASEDKEQWLQNIEQHYGGAEGDISRETVDFWRCKGLELAGEEVKKCLYYTRSAMDDAGQDECLQTAYLPALTDDESYYCLLLKAIEEHDEEKIVPLSHPVYTRFKQAGTASEVWKERVSSKRTKAKTIMKKTTERYLSFSSEKIAKDLLTVRPAALVLTSLLRQLDETLLAEKQEANALSFDDLEHLTVSLLTEKDSDGNRVLSKLAEETALRFDEVMVDEYQDTNPVQALIYRILSEDGKKLFMVGDVKQAIYAFRNATPEDYMAKKDAYPAYDREHPAFPAKIALSANFRSHSGITDAVNFIFEHLCSKRLGGTEYGKDEALIPKGLYTTEDAERSHVELHFSQNGDESDKFWEDCVYIADRIEKLIGEKTQISVGGGERRPLRYGDIVVLCRTGDLAEPLGKELKKRNIPLISSGGRKLTEAHEVQVVLSLLKVLDNPYRDVPLAAVLLSPLCGSTPDELSLVRTEHRSVPFYEAVTQYAEQHGAKKLSLFLDKLDGWRKLSAEIPPDELLLRIYADTSMAAVLSSDGGKSSVKGNLDLLVNLAGNHPSSGNGSLASFLRYMEKSEEYKSKIMAAADDRDNGVRLMTVHGSKGLEFPVVFLAGIRSFNRRDMNNRCLVHREYGFGCRIREGNTYYSTLPRNIIQHCMRQEQNSEELRILYVALTRASHYLFVSSCFSNLTREVERLNGIHESQEAVRFSADEGESFADWLLISSCLHPAGESLCKAGGLVPRYTSRECQPLLVTVTFPQEDGDTLAMETAEQTEEPRDETAILSEEDCQQAETLFSWRYPYEVDTKLPTKVSVSAVSHGTYVGQASHIRPSFASEDDRKLRGAEAGTAIHLFMSLLDFSSDMPIAEQLQTLTDKGRLTKQQVGAIDIAACEKLLASDLGKRICRAAQEGRLYREYPFVANSPAKEVTADKTAEGTVLVRGTVDLLFTEGDCVVVVDFKSDRVKQAEELKDRYGKQLKLYAKAVSALWKTDRVDCYLWSFTHNCAVYTENGLPNVKPL